MVKDNQYLFYKDHIVFRFYNLQFSSLHKNPILTLERINAVDFNTSPHSLIIDNREIIFLNHNDKTSLKLFAVTNNLTISNHPDVWEIINRPFLDNADGITKEDFEVLEKLGITKGLLTNIHHKIKSTFWWSMEWQYLGLWDLLHYKQYRNPLYRLTGKPFYWWAMHIALMDTIYVKEESESTSI